MAIPRWTRSILAALALVTAHHDAARAVDPELPPGLDPGGVAIALITTGIDYTDPLIASRLARDGEGQLIGWDFVDNDITPYGTESKANAQAKLLLATNPDARLIVIRISPHRAEHLARAVMFIARTPASIAAVPFSGTNTRLWAPFVNVVRSIPNTLFIVSAGTAEQTSGNAPIWPGAGKHKNTVVAAPFGTDQSSVRGGKSIVAYQNVDAWVVSASADSNISAQNSARLSSADAVMILSAKAACVMKDVVDTITATELRTKLLESAHKVATGGTIAVHNSACE